MRTGRADHYTLANAATGVTAAAYGASVPVAIGLGATLGLVGLWAGRNGHSKLFPGAPEGPAAAMLDLTGYFLGCSLFRWVQLRVENVK